MYKLCEQQDRPDLIRLLLERLDVTPRGHARALCTKLLSLQSVDIRLITFEFLSGLVSNVGGQTRCHPWILHVMIAQLQGDPKQCVVTKRVLSILTVVSEDPAVLDMLVNLKPNIAKIGKSGITLLVRLFSHSEGNKLLRDHHHDHIRSELARWHTKESKVHVCHVEACLVDATDSYPTSAARDRSESDPSAHLTSPTSTFEPLSAGCVPAPIHFYRELCQSVQGADLIFKSSIIGEITNAIKQLKNCNTSKAESLLESKAAIWALGYIGSCAPGLAIIPTALIKEVALFASTGRNLFIRGTCIYCLSLIGMTAKGSQLLAMCGWHVQHTNNGDCSTCTAVPHDILKIFKGTAKLRLFERKKSLFAPNIVVGRSIFDLISETVALVLPDMDDNECDEQGDSKQTMIRNECPEKVVDAVLSCVKCMSNEILHSKARDLVSRLRLNYRDIVESFKLYWGVREIVDAGYYTLETRRLLYSLFPDPTFLATEWKENMELVKRSVLSMKFTSDTSTSTPTEPEPPSTDDNQHSAQGNVADAAPNVLAQPTVPEVRAKQVAELAAESMEKTETAVNANLADETLQQKADGPSGQAAHDQVQTEAADARATANGIEVDVDVEATTNAGTGDAALPKSAVNNVSNAANDTVVPKSDPVKAPGSASTANAAYKAPYNIHADNTQGGGPAWNFDTPEIYEKELKDDIAEAWSLAHCEMNASSANVV